MENTKKNRRRTQSNKPAKGAAPSTPLSKLANTQIKKFESFLTLAEIRKEIPQSEASKRVILEGRENFRKVLQSKDDRFVIIMGPCSIHDPKAAVEYAERFLALKKAVADRLLLFMRVYFEKPRTTVGWKGLINDPDLNDSFKIQKGLRLARKLLIKLSEKGVFPASELLDPITAAYLSELISWASIGARTTESQIHREMVSGLSMPVGFKNNTEGNLAIALNAIVSSISPHIFLGTDDLGRVSVVHTKGNEDTHIVLRGGTGRPNYSPAKIKKLETELQRRNFPLRIMVDCSHDNSGKNHEKQAAVAHSLLRQKKSGNTSIFGMMIESNLVAGNQQFSPSKGNKDKLRYGLSITDQCIGWEESEALVREFYEKL